MKPYSQFKDKFNNEYKFDNYIDFAKFWFALSRKQAKAYFPTTFTSLQNAAANSKEARKKITGTEREVKGFFIPEFQQWIYHINGKPFLRSVEKLNERQIKNYLQKKNFISGIDKKTRLIVSHFARTLATKHTTQAGRKLNQWRWHKSIKGIEDKNFSANEVTKVN